MDLFVFVLLVHRQMKPVPDTVKFVCESFKVPKITLKDAAKRILRPPLVEEKTGWPRIHDQIKNND